MGNDYPAIKCGAHGNIKPHKAKVEDTPGKPSDVARSSYDRLNSSIFGEKILEPEPVIFVKPEYKPTDAPAYDYRNQWNVKEGFVEPKMADDNKIVQQMSVKDANLPSVLTTTAFTLRGASEGSTLSLSKPSQDWDAQFNTINANKEGESADVVTEGEYNSFVSDYEREAGTTKSKQRDLNETVANNPTTVENKKAMYSAMAGADGVMSKEDYSGFMKGLMAKGEVAPGDNGEVTKVNTAQFVDYVNSKTTATPLDKSNPTTKTETETTSAKAASTTVPEFPVPSAEEFKSKYNLDVDPSIVSKYQEKNEGGQKGFEIELKDGTFIRNSSENGAVLARTNSKESPSISYDSEGKLVIANSRRLDVIAGEKLPGVTFDNCMLCEYQSSSKTANDNVTLNNSDFSTLVLDKGQDTVTTTGKNNKFNTFVKADSDLNVSDSAQKEVQGKPMPQSNRIIVDADYNEVHDASVTDNSTLSESGKKISKEIQLKNDIERFWNPNQLNFKTKD